MDNVIVTGSNGSIGSALVEYFNDCGWKVIPYDPRSGKYNGDRANAIIVAHGGTDSLMEGVFNKNVFSMSGILDSLNDFIVKDGSVIVITSRRALRPTIKEIDYSASKAAIHAYVKALYKGYPNLRITAIAPGWVESKMTDKGFASSVISIKEFCQVVKVVIDCKNIRIPEIFMEPIGDSEF